MAAQNNTSVTVGIDVGGTFTDLLAVDAEAGTVKLAKVATTPDNQAIGFMAALAAAGTDPATLQAVVHGTTTTTNALLERKIAKVGLITTKGFRDVLELGRRTRPQPYGLRGTFRPLIEREYRLEVPERMDADGKVLAPLDEAAVAEAANKLLALGCEAVVIHFLHSYINPAHERRAAEIVRGLWPNAYVTAGPLDPVGIPRVRARRDGGGQRLGAAGARPLSHAPAHRAQGQGLRPRHPGDAGQRRHRSPRS